MPRAIHICGDDSLTLAECSDCNEVKSRVARLEECCDTVKNTLSNHDTRITNNANNITKNANDITQLRNDLANYYTKSETYTRQEVLDLIGNIETVSIKAVDSLPDTGESNVIYLVSNGGKKPDVKDEYIWVNNEWEKIGNTKIDLSDYATKTYVDNGLAIKQDSLTAGDNITIIDNKISAEIPSEIPSDYVEQSVFNTNMQNIADVANDQCSRIATLEECCDSVKTTIAGKQDMLTAGDNITISNNVISAINGGGGTEFFTVELNSNTSAVNVINLVRDDFKNLSGYDVSKTYIGYARVHIETTGVISDEIETFTVAINNTPSADLSFAQGNYSQASSIPTGQGATGYTFGCPIVLAKNPSRLGIWGDAYKADGTSITIGTMTAELFLVKLP